MTRFSQLVNTHSVKRSPRILLPVRRPYDFRRSILSYGYWELPPYRWDPATSTLQRVERLNGRLYLLEFRQGPHRSQSETTVALSVTGGTNPRAISELVERSRAMLRLDDDLSDFYRLCRNVPWLRQVPTLGVGRLIRGSSLWEDVVKTIAWTNTTWAQAVKMVGRLATLGDTRPDTPDLHAWPTPGQVLCAGIDFLTKEARLGYRAAYLLQLAREVERGARDLGHLNATARSLDSVLLARELMTIKGVGPASAAYLLTMLGHYDHLILDSATTAFLVRTFFKGKTPTRKRIERQFASLGRWRGLGLWFSFFLGRKSQR